MTWKSSKLNVSKCTFKSQNVSVFFFIKKLKDTPIRFRLCSSKKMVYSFNDIT